MTTISGRTQWHRGEVAEGLSEALLGLSLVVDDDGFSRCTPSLWKSLTTAGWFELLVGLEEVPGPDTARSLRERVGAISEFERYRIPGPVASTVGFVVPLISNDATDEASLRLLEMMTAEGKLVVHASRWADAFAPDDAAASERRLEFRERPGGGSLTGSVRGVPHARGADVLLVPVKRADGNTGVLAVEPERDGVGVQRSSPLDRRLEYDTVIFDEVEILDRDFVGGPSADLGGLVARSEGWYFVALNALASGGGDALIDRTRDYVVDREQFGVPVGAFQAVKHMMAEMYKLNENGRAFTMSAAEALLCDDDAWMDDVLASRLYTGRGYVEIGELAMQCHGGFGYTWEQEIHFWYRSALDGIARPHEESDLIGALSDRLGLP